jgi:hypothetical protein
MTFTREELKKLLPAVLIALALLGGGLAAIWSANQALLVANRSLAGVQADRKKAAERLARISEEEREVNQKLDVYRRLQSLRILGEERRLEWADAITRIRKERELLDLSYRVDRQRLLLSAPGKPGNVDLYASTMRVNLALLHEGDLLRFLGDLRESGNAFYAVRRCALARTGQAATGTSITPRLRADCDIELVTMIDGGAKQP